MRLDRKMVRVFNPNKGTWQRDCYRHYRICGEARYAATFMGNAISRAVLSIVNEKGETVSDGPAVDALDTLFNGSMGQSQMLADIGVHLTIAGEVYLIGRDVNGVDVWEIVSVEEIQVVGTKWKLTYANSDIPDQELSDKDVVIRIWCPMPGNRMDADSPFRSLLPILTEIEWLTSHVFSQIRSRLVSAGILFLSQGMTFPPPPEKDGKAQNIANEAEAFMLTLAAGMEKALKRDGSPEEVVPLVVMAPGEEIQHARLMEFWSSLDAESKELRSEAIRRFATGMNLPPEEILGMGSNPGTGGGTSNGVSHWGAWQIEESTIKMHVEPLLDTIVNALTIGYIRPLLGDGATERVAYDTSKLKLRPDRSQESMELYDRGLVTGKVVVRENGFDETSDMPNDNELVLWLLKKVAAGSTTPEQVAQALTALGVQGMEPTETTPNTPTEERPPPSLEEHPSRPRTPEENALLYACDALVWRALELAGKRAINAGLRGKDRDKTIEPTEFHLERRIEGDPMELLKDAFAYAPKVLGSSPLINILNDYCAALITAQAPHTRDNLTSYLTARGVAFAGERTQTPTVNLNVNVEGANHHITVPEQTPPELTLNPTFHLNPQFDVTTPEVSLTPTFNLEARADVAPPEIHFSPNMTIEPQMDVNPTFNVESPTVNVTNEVATPNVTVNNDVQTPQVNVDVAAPEVTVNPKVTADVKMPPTKPKKTKVIYNEDGSISGTEEVK